MILWPRCYWQRTRSCVDCLPFGFYIGLTQFICTFFLLLASDQVTGNSLRISYRNANFAHSLNHSMWSNSNKKRFALSLSAQPNLNCILCFHQVFRLEWSLVSVDKWNDKLICGRSSNHRSDKGKSIEQTQNWFKCSVGKNAHKLRLVVWALKTKRKRLDALKLIISFLSSQPDFSYLCKNVMQRDFPSTARRSDHFAERIPVHSCSKLNSNKQRNKKLELIRELIS